MEHAIGCFPLWTGGLTAPWASRTGLLDAAGYWCTLKMASAFDRCGCTVCTTSRREMPSSHTYLHHLVDRYLCCTAVRARNVMAIVCHPLGAIQTFSALDMCAHARSAGWLSPAAWWLHGCIHIIFPFFSLPPSSVSPRRDVSLSRPRELGEDRNMR